MVIGRAMLGMFGLLVMAGQPWPGPEPPVATAPGEHRISFRARNGLIYIPAEVNGNHATLLLDTGAVLTTFSLKVVPTVHDGPRITINTAKGSITAFQVAVGFNLGEAGRKESRAFRQNVVVGDFKFGEADGVIGLDVLSSFRVVTVDFQNSALILRDR